MSLGRLGGVAVLLHAGSVLADHWLQTPRQAELKVGDGWPARMACARHVAVLTATQAALLGAGCLATQERLAPSRTVTGLAFNAISHYLLDRRPLAHRLACVIGSRDLYERFPVQRQGWLDRYGPGSGSYALDQSAHDFLAVVAVLIVVGGGRS